MPELVDTHDSLSATRVKRVLEPTRQFSVKSCIRVGDRIQYDSCFVPTFVAPSAQPSGGDGLFTVERLRYDARMGGSTAPLPCCGLVGVTGRNIGGVSGDA